MLIDSTKCATGCTDCVSACGKENGFGSTGHPETDAQWIRKIELKEVKSGKSHSLPMMCQHCAEPPCVDVCPTGASFKRADGIVLVDRHICIGCRYCMMACPYKARSSFMRNTKTRTRRAARQGLRRILYAVRAPDRQGPATACVEACSDANHGAMLFGDLNDPTARYPNALPPMPPPKSVRIWREHRRSLPGDLTL